MAEIRRLLVTLQDLLRGILYRYLFRHTLRRRARSMICHIQPELPVGSSLLDVGAGIGDVAQELTRTRAVHCVGLDHKRLLFQPASPRSLVLGDAHEMAFQDESFDTVLLVTVLHHCRQPRQVLREARRVTKGRILVVEDVYASRPGRILTIIKDAILNLELFGHPRQFHSPPQWEDLFSQVGLSVESKKEFRFRMLWVCRARHILYRLRKAGG